MPHASAPETAVSPMSIGSYRLPSRGLALRVPVITNRRRHAFPFGDVTMAITCSSYYVTDSARSWVRWAALRPGLPVARPTPRRGDLAGGILDGVSGWTERAVIGPTRRLPGPPVRPARPLRRKRATHQAGPAQRPRTPPAQRTQQHTPPAQRTQQHTPPAQPAHRAGAAQQPRRPRQRSPPARRTRAAGPARPEHPAQPPRGRPPSAGPCSGTSAC
jgi:hypothetical protein